MNNVSLSFLLLSCVFSEHLLAGPADYIYVPTIEFGEREIEIKHGTTTLPNGDRSHASTLGLGYGIREYWFTEVSIKNKRTGGNETNLVEWENKFQLTETGQYSADFGLLAELEAPLTNNTPWELKVGGLLQTEFSKLQLNGNVLFKRAFGLAGSSFETQLLYQWQAKYRWQPALEFGVQGFGEMGKWNDWANQANQNHRVGPAVFGKLALGNRQAIKYNAAWLFGASAAAPDHTFRMQVEYEF